MKITKLNVNTKFMASSNYMDWDDEPCDNLNEIEPNLHLGCYSSAQNQEPMQRLGVTHVLALLDSFLSYRKYDGIQYMTIEIDDSPSVSIIDYLPEAIRFISEGQKHGAVIVHCLAGVSRSASIVIGYLMVKYSLRFDDAKSLVKSKRPCIWPNFGFEQQLSNIEIDYYKQFLK